MYAASPQWFGQRKLIVLRCGARRPVSHHAAGRALEPASNRRPREMIATAGAISRDRIRLTGPLCFFLSTVAWDQWSVGGGGEAIRACQHMAARSRGHSTLQSSEFGIAKVCLLADSLASESDRCESGIDTASPRVSARGSARDSHPSGSRRSPIGLMTASLSRVGR